MNRRSEREARRLQRRKRRRILGIVSAAARLVLAGTAGIAWAGGAWGGIPEPCTKPVQLTVVADPAISAAVDAVAAAYDASDGSCSRTKVVAQSSADAAARLASGVASDVDAWIPDSPVWIVRMSSMARSLGRSVPPLALERSIASTPVVFAAPAALAGEFAGRHLSWKGLLNGDFTALLPDPEAASASLGALQALERRVDLAVPRQFQSTMIRLSDHMPATTEAAFAELAAADPGTVAITSEQRVAQQNRDGADALLALYPEDGTLALEYPFLRLLDESELAKNLPAEGEDTAADPKHEQLERRAAQLDALKIALWESVDRFAEEGFRDGHGEGRLALDGVVAEATAVDAVAASSQVSILRSWGVLSLRSRILAVVDLSGSMEEPTVSGMRRIDLLQQAASGTISQFTGQVELGLWGFSTLRDGSRDWEDLVPVGSLANDRHRDRIMDAIGSLPARLGGATGLYDTVLAAVDATRTTFDPERVNAVLLLTDGKNEDDATISLEQLLDELGAAADPARPVPVVLVGIGPDTDMTSMREIAEATGGAAYSAARPEDLTVVLTDALSQRACRPNC